MRVCEVFTEPDLHNTSLSHGHQTADATNLSCLLRSVSKYDTVRLRGRLLHDEFCDHNISQALGPTSAVGR